VSHGAFWFSFQVVDIVAVLSITGTIRSCCTTEIGGEESAAFRESTATKFPPLELCLVIGFFLEKGNLRGGAAKCNFLGIDVDLRFPEFSDPD